MADALRAVKTMSVRISRMTVLMIETRNYRSNRRGGRWNTSNKKNVMEHLGRSRFAFELKAVATELNVNNPADSSMRCHRIVLANPGLEARAHGILAVARIG